MVNFVNYNDSIMVQLSEELQTSTLYWLLISMAAAIFWIIYITYYNSRVFGAVLTLILNRFVKFGYIKFGSFTFSVLSGKVMFRDVCIITEDFSFRIQLGLAIFRWWRPLVQKEINEDLSHSETRLSVYLDSFELHVYNRSQMYAKLEKLFGLDELILGPQEHDPGGSDGKGESTAKTKSAESRWQWRDLIPVIKMEIASGRLLFGNYTLPTMLCMNVGDIHLVYTTKPASTPFDKFMHIVKAKADSVRVLLVPSKKGGTMVDEPPRLMGEGFVLLQSNDVDIYYYQDEPDLVPFHPEQVQLANGDLIARRTWPCWGMDVKCGKSTDISYGPWADRQREYLWKFFYPADYQDMESSSLPEPGQPRIFRSFDFKMSMQNDCTVDILFTKNKETQAVHMSCQAGSYLEFSIPMLTENIGYSTKVTGQLMHLDATTSLQFRSLLECETLEFDVEACYPSHWNQHQEWRCDLTACKASGYIIFHHKVFFVDLVDDWSSKSIPDIYHFIPYTWRFNLILKQFELATLANEWNWIDCFGSTPENARIAFCGDMFDMSFTLPFIDYLPPTVPIKIFLRGESADCRLHLPETNTSRHIIMAMSEHMKIVGRDGNVLDSPFQGLNHDKWRRITQKSCGWVDVWTTPIIALSIGYIYHPMPTAGDEQHKLLSQTNDPDSTLDEEEMLIIPLRLVPLRPLRPSRPQKDGKYKNLPGAEEEEFDPTTIEADLITVELEVGPSVLCVYGSLLRNFLHVKENYFGEDQKFTDYGEVFSQTDKQSTFEHITSPVDRRDHPFDPRRYRPLEVKVQATLHDIQAHLPKNCQPDDAPCPCVYLERVGFEMDKKYLETKLEVLASPAVLIASDAFQGRPGPHNHLQNGHLALSGLQVRGNAMFSHKGLPLESETLEYAWLMEIIIGDLTGRLTSPQLQNIVECLQTFIFLVEDSENDLQRPVPYRICQHGFQQPDCNVDPLRATPCLTGDDIKYRMTRVSVDCVDLYLVEAGTALNVQIFPIRLATCNLHGKNNKSGITALLPQISLKQFVLSVPVMDQWDEKNCWLEAGGVSIGPINIDAAMALPSPEYHSVQHRFLLLHDRQTRRLNFMWSAEEPSTSGSETSEKCGCLGGCKFFGSNRNGPLFFQPADEDYLEGINAAVFHLFKEDGEYGYGQSLLQPGQFMFEVHPSGMPVTPSKAKLQNRHRLMRDRVQPSTDTLKSSATLVEHMGEPHQSGYISDISADDEGEDGTLTRDIKPLRQPIFKKGSMSSSGTGTISKDSSKSSDYMPGSPMPDAYDTDHFVSSPSDTGGPWLSGESGSINSIPYITGEGTNNGTKHVQSAKETLKSSSAATPSRNLKPMGSVDSVSAKSSVVSFHRDVSLGSELRSSNSRQSSLTSPILRRLSSQFSLPEGSVSSFTGSEKFFSAAEEADSSDTDSQKTLSETVVCPWDTAYGDKSASQTVIEATLMNEDSEVSGTSSESLASFVSAVSSQHASRVDLNRQPGYPLSDIQEDQIHLLEKSTDEEYTNIDDVTVQANNLVDLKGQINQPITNSPLLMNCYMNHMTQLQCSHWSAPAPLPHMTSQQPTNHIAEDPSCSSFSSRMSPPTNGNFSQTPVWIPQFQYMRQGFSPSVMVKKCEPKTPPSLSSLSSTSDREKKGKFFPAEDEMDSNSDSTLQFEDHVSKTTATVNLKGSVDIMVSPLMLEALQRYVEAVTPVLSSMHPCAIIDSLHSHCSNAVKAQNKLKKQQSEHESPDRKDDNRDNKTKQGIPKKLDQSVDHNVDTVVADSKTSRLQISIALSKINICILQASLVEEVISFSALDQVNEITCVSVLSVCFDNISCLILLNNHSQKSLEAVNDSSPDSTSKNLPTGDNKRMYESGLSMSGVEDNEKQMVERQQEDMVGNLNIARIHFQLRRMKRDCNFSDNVFLTAIPEHRSKVLFTFQKLSTFPECLIPFPTASTSSDPQESKVSVNTAEDIAGFIMFECGLENIDLRAARRMGYQSSTSNADDDITPTADTSFYLPSQVSNSQSVGQDNVGADTRSNPNSDNDANSWRSDISVGASDDTNTDEDELNVDSLSGDASNCVLEFKSVWFNFAAPPPSPKKKKLNYTRLDWNLLSTATPAINAWLNPGHRAIMEVYTLLRYLESRISVVMACIMTEALEVQGIHMPVRSKINKITSLSKTLQEDPSCQLLTVLRRYVARVGVLAVEDSVNTDTVPQLLTIQKGLLALTRQWKNILYMPILADSSFKSKKKIQPYTVTFAIPAKEESVDNIHEEGIIDDGEITLDNYEVVDEKTSLLKAEGGSVIHDESFHSLSGSLQNPSVPLVRSASTGHVPAAVATCSADKPHDLVGGRSADSVKHSDRKAGRPRHHAQESTVYNSAESNFRQTMASQKSVDSAIAGTSLAGLRPGPPVRSQSLAVPGINSGSASALGQTGGKMGRNESNVSFQSGSVSMSSVDPIGLQSVPGTPMRQSLTRHLSELEKREGEDLYQWMQRQQEYTRLCTHPNLHCYPSMGQESLINAGLSEYSQDDSMSLQRLAAMTHPTLQMVDAQILFKPLLRAIGLNIGAIKTTALIKKFGGNVSVIGKLQVLRIDIVDSEITNKSRRGRKGKTRTNLPKFHIDTGFATPAFLCDAFAVMINLKDVVDFEKNKDDIESGVYGPDSRRRSLRALRLAMSHMESKPTTTKVNFSVQSHSISQHVNMSLLRLVHQFVTMIQNINLTRTELKQHSKVDIFRGHRKQDSKGSSTATGTDVQSEDGGKKEEVGPKANVLTPESDQTVRISQSSEESTQTASSTAKMVTTESFPRPDRLHLSFGDKSPLRVMSRKGIFDVLGTVRGSSEESESQPILQSPPNSLNLDTDSVVVEVGDTSSPALAEKTIVDEINEHTPKCWKTLYHLLNLYSTMPEPKTIARPAPSRLSVIDEEPEKGSQTQSFSKQGSTQKINAHDGADAIERQPVAPAPAQILTKTYTGSTFTQSILIGEKIPLVVFGMAKVKRIKISALLSGLKLEADLQNAHASTTHRERVKGVIKRKSSESSVTAHIGHTMIVLLEGVPPSMQTVVTVNVAKSQGLYSTITKRSHDQNSALVTIGQVDVDIPQHPVVLHGMVARSSKRLSSTLQEFIRPPTKVRSYDSIDTGIPSQPSKHSELNEAVSGGTPQMEQQTKPAQPAETPAKPVVIHLKSVLQGLTIGASLLPSLKARYTMGEVTSCGVTGRKSRFTVDLLKHSLSFTSKVSTQSNLPSSASIDLPPIHVHADYRRHVPDSLSDQGGLTEGLMLREGNYFNAVAEVGAFENSLTTDLLNHLVFVQKVFMKEINEVVQKVSGGDQPVPLWSDEGFPVHKDFTKQMLYSLQFRLKAIQITATTPTNNAVRLETGTIELELSNRVQPIKKDETTIRTKDTLKVFVKMQLDVNLALGTLLKNQLFEEAEPEFQHLASFATRIAMRNALQDEMIPGASKDQEALLISLKRPIVFVQPVAFDKAVLVWLNYKNAYEYWNEQRLALNNEVQTATQQVMDRLPLTALSQPSAPALSTLFLQLTVDDLGICLPLGYTNVTGGPNKMIDEPGAAMVLTLDQTQLSACSCGSLVSKGTFNGFCLRFADDFEVSWDDWGPAGNLGKDTVMNAMVVPDGTYEVCSQTRSAQPNEPFSNPKWILNITFRMRGLDIHLDTNIGKQLSLLGNALTTLTGDDEFEDLFEEGVDEDEMQMPDLKSEDGNRNGATTGEDYSDGTFDSKMDPKRRARMIEQEMNEQAKVVEDLKQLGASASTVEIEERKLQELQAVVFHDFRQDIMNKLKRQSGRATTLKDRLGLGYKSTHGRPKSGSISVMPPTRRTRPIQRRYTFDEDSDREVFTSPRPNFSQGHHRALSVDVSDLASQQALLDSSSGSPSSPTSAQTDLLSTTLDDSIWKNKPRLTSNSPLTPPYQRLSLQDIAASSSESDTEVATFTAASHPVTGPIQEEDGRSAEDIVHDIEAPQKTASPSQGSGGSQKASVMEPNVDFEMDIKVDIDSGRCVLHPKEPKVEPESEQKSYRSGFISRNQSSPQLNRKKLSHSKKSVEQTTSRLHNLPAISNITQFFLPAVDVKVHYNSKTSPSVLPESPSAVNLRGLDIEPVGHVGGGNLLSPPVSGIHTSFLTSTPDSLDPQSGTAASAKKASTKKASLYACIILEQLSEEMLISPALLDFLEQALEPIPIHLIQTKSSKHQPVHRGNSNNTHEDLEASVTSLSSGPASYASFPVDVVVSILVQPSIIRFTCLPVSRVECLLRLPSLDVVFSSKRADVESTQVEADKVMKATTFGLDDLNSQRKGKRMSTGSRTRTASGHQVGDLGAGGLSVTACMADFSLYIFHPYGGGQKKTSLSSLESAFRKSHMASLEGGTSPMLDTTSRKDSLSLNVEFVKVNISRSRKGGFLQEAHTLLQNKLQPAYDTQHRATNVVRFSAMCDIGSASFKYDMRRLSEILALPKAWYRRTLARRMFLGEETAILDSDSENEGIDVLSSSPPTPDSPVFSPYGKAQTFSSLHSNVESHAKHRRVASEDRSRKLTAELTRELQGLQNRHGSAPQSPQDARHSAAHASPKSHTGIPRPNLHGIDHSDSFVRPPSTSGPSTNQTGRMKEWQTLVIFAVNLSRLDVMVNMSNVMGNTIWSTQQLESQGRLSIDSTGYNNMKIRAGLGSSKLESRGGIVGGNIELQKLDACLRINEDPGQEPDHTASLVLDIMESRLDYMGSSVLMFRICKLGAELCDEWRVAHCKIDDAQPLATKRPALIFVKVDLNWDKFHMMISRSTTPDLIKMANKLEEFFTQQFNSSKRVLSAFGPITSTSRHKHKRRTSETASWISEIRHHRHWRKVLEAVTGCKLSMLNFTLPDHGAILGGTMVLHGNNLTLACFHGINFRSKSWALFTMDEPDICFATESQDVLDGDEHKCTHVVQNLTFQLGHNVTERRVKKPMAMVCKLSRGHYMPPPFTSVQDWFHYAFATSEIKDLDSFPQMGREGSESPTDRRGSSLRRPAENHDTEVIFVLPSLQMHLKTEHMQGEDEPADGDDKPVVDCSFVTEFEDHIFVAMDAEVIFFLHDLVTNYVKEKDKGLARVQRSPEMEKKLIADTTALLKQDYREFECNTWHLEPTVRLLSWAGKRIDPVGVDYILQKLGFQHARLTIPKWMQRGCMDPLDKILSILVHRMILLLKENNAEDDTSSVDLL